MSCLRCVEQFGETASCVLVHLEVEDGFVCGEVAEVGAVELFGEAVCRNFRYEEGLGHLLELVQKLDYLPKGGFVGHGTVAVAARVPCHCGLRPAIPQMMRCRIRSGMTRGASPSGFDCSGFVMYCYQSYYNISLPHGATSVSYKGYEVDRSDIQVGDIICFDRNGDGTMEHCALYVGNDTYVHAKGSQWGVVSDCFSSASGVAHIRRVL